MVVTGAANPARLMAGYRQSPGRSAQVRGATGGHGLRVEPDSYVTRLIVVTTGLWLGSCRFRMVSLGRWVAPRLRLSGWSVVGRPGVFRWTVAGSAVAGGWHCPGCRAPPVRGTAPAAADENVPRGTGSPAAGSFGEVPAGSGGVGCTRSPATAAPLSG